MTTVLQYVRLHKFTIIILLIFILGAFLRLWNAPFRYQLDGDGIRDAIISYEGAKYLHYPLTGPFSSTGPYTFGPWYYYVTITATLLFRNPFTPWYVMALFSLWTIYLMFRIGTLLESKVFGLVLAFFAAIAPPEVSVGSGLSNINLVPVFTTASLFFFIKLVSDRKISTLWLFLFGTTLGLAINAHYQAAGLLVLPLVLWFALNPKNLRIPLFIGCGIFVTFIPLLLFNLQTHWDTIRGMALMYSSKGSIYVPNSWKLYIFDFLPKYLNWILAIPSAFAVLISLCYACYLSIRGFKRKLPISFMLLAGVFALNIIFLRYYWGERHFTYLYYLEPFVLVFFSHALFSLTKIKYGFLVLILGGVFVSYYMIQQDLPQMSDKQAGIRDDTTALLAFYPNNAALFYTCKTTNDAAARSMAYFQEFRLPSGSAKKIGVLTNAVCSYPNYAQYNLSSATVSAQIGGKIYPAIKNTSFIDFSNASEAALQKASWKEISPKQILEETTDWWKKK